MHEHIEPHTGRERERERERDRKKHTHTHTHLLLINILPVLQLAVNWITFLKLILKDTSF